MAFGGVAICCAWWAILCYVCMCVVCENVVLVGMCLSMGRSCCSYV